MNPQKSLLLGSGLLTSLVLASPSASAETTLVVEEIVFEAPEAQAILGGLNCSCTSSDRPAQPATTDSEGATAIDLLGCDCNGCRNTVRQLVQALPTRQ